MEGGVKRAVNRLFFFAPIVAKQEHHDRFTYP